MGDGQRRPERNGTPMGISKVTKNDIGKEVIYTSPVNGESANAYIFKIDISRNKVILLHENGSKMPMSIDFLEYVEPPEFKCVNCNQCDKHNIGRERIYGCKLKAYKEEGRHVHLTGCPLNMICNMDVKMRKLAFLKKSD